MNEKVNEWERQEVCVFNYRQCWMEPMDFWRFTFLNNRCKGTITTLRFRGVTDSWIDKEPFFPPIPFQIYLRRESLHFWQFLWLMKMAKEIIASQKSKGSRIPLFMKIYFLKWWILECASLTGDRDMFRILKAATQKKTFPEAYFCRNAVISSRNSSCSTACG